MTEGRRLTAGTGGLGMANRRRHRDTAIATTGGTATARVRGMTTHRTAVGGTLVAAAAAGAAAAAAAAETAAAAAAVVAAAVETAVTARTAGTGAETEVPVAAAAAAGTAARTGARVKSGGPRPLLAPQLPPPPPPPPTPLTWPLLLPPVHPSCRRGFSLPRDRVAAQGSLALRTTREAHPAAIGVLLGIHEADAANIRRDLTPPAWGRAHGLIIYCVRGEIGPAAGPRIVSGLAILDATRRRFFSIFRGLILVGEC